MGPPTTTVRMMAVSPTPAGAAPAAATATPSGASPAQQAAQQSAQQAAQAAQLAQQTSQPQGVQPAPQCNTSCAAYGGTYVCLTPTGQTQACIVSSAPVAAPRYPAGTGVSTGSGTTDGSNTGSGTPVPAADCVTSCQLFQGAQMCSTSAGQLRMCTGVTAAAGVRQVEAAANPPPSPPAAGSAGPVATLSGLPICSAYRISGGTGRGGADMTGCVAAMKATAAAAAPAGVSRASRPVTLFMGTPPQSSASWLSSYS